MPANIKISVDATSAGIQIQSLDQSIKQQETGVKKIVSQIKNNWVLISQVANASLQLAAKALEGTAAAGAIQIAQTGLQVAQTEVAIYRLGVQAVAAFTAGQVGAGFAFLGLAGALQTTIVMSIAQQASQRENARIAKELARQLESYS